jgi:hypothetical protein
MTEEGFFVLDFMNEGFLRHALVTTTQKTVGDVLVEQQRWFSNDDRLINEITIRRGSTNTVYRESVRAYTYPEIELLFRHAGLTVDSVFGGYDLSEYSKETSKRMLIIGRRKELPRSKMRSLVWSADTRGQITSMPSARAA